MLIVALPTQAEDQLTVISLPEVNENEVVHFKDDTLRKLVQARYPNEDILVKHIKQMNIFKGQGITSLMGLEHAYNLTTFEAKNGEVTDLSPLKNWQSLYDLNLMDNELTSIATLAETGKTVRQVVYRQQINLANNKLTDLTPLKTWDFLKHLDVSNNALKNIEVLKEFTHLEYLNIKGNPLTKKDVEILRELVRRGVKVETDVKLHDSSDVFFYSKELETIIRKQLNLTGPITTEALAKLTTLDLSHTKVADLRGLEAAVNLTSLNISYTEIYDLKVIAALQKLEILNIASTQVSNLQWLGHLSLLKELDASYLHINGEFPIIKSLQKLNLSYARYDRLAVFTKSKFTSLKELILLDAYYAKTEMTHITALQREGVIVRYSEARVLKQQDVKLYVSLDTNEKIKEITRLQLYSKDIRTLYGATYASYDFKNLRVHTDSTGKTYVLLPNIALAEDYQLTLQIGTSIRIEQVLDLSVTQTSVVITAPRRITGTLVNKFNEPLVNYAVYTAEGTIYTNVRGEFTYETYRDAISLYTMSNGTRMLIKTIDFTKESYRKIVKLGVFQLAAIQGTEKIHGTITDVNGKRIVKGQVRVETLGGVFVANTIMDKDGYFSVDGLASGQYRLYVKDVTGMIIYQVVIVHTQQSQQQWIVQVVTAGAWYGEGNRFISNQQKVAPGQYVAAQLRYRNNSAKVLTNVRIKLTETVALRVVKEYTRLNGKKVKWLDDRTLEIGKLLPGESGKLSMTALVEEDHHQEDLSLKATLTSAEGEKQEFINEFKKIRVTLAAPAVTTIKEIKLHGQAIPNAKVTLLLNGNAVGETIANTKWWTATVHANVAAGEAFEVQAKVDSGGRTFYSEKRKMTYQPAIPKITDAKVTIARFDTPLNPYVGIATSSIIILPGYRKTAQDMDFAVTFDKAISSAQLLFLNKTYPLKQEGGANRYTGHIEGNWEEYSNQTVEIQYIANGETYRMPVLELTPIIDPSGYVFEGSMENRIPNVSAMIQERKGQMWLDWNAARFAQVNPQRTDEEGRYGWDVPKGDWQVVFTKAGYKPYTSRMVTVPPPEMELNIPLISTESLRAEVEKVGNDKIKIRFNRPVNERELASNIIVTHKDTGEAVAGTLTLQKWAGYKEAAPGQFVEDKEQSLSRDVIFALKVAGTTADDYNVKLQKNIVDYRGVTLGTDYILSTSQQVITKNHVLQVSFSNDFDINKAREAIKMKDMAGVLIPVQVEKVGTTVHIHPPSTGYRKGDYNLVIASDFASVTGQAISYEQLIRVVVQ